MAMEPYIKAKSPLRGENKPKIFAHPSPRRSRGAKHGAGLPAIQRRQKEEIAATKRALKKAARREGRREIEEEE